MRGDDSTTPVTGLVLTGGGARAAYQVGVLTALLRLRRTYGQDGAANPFPVLTGTSAGAINAAALACRADNFEDAVDALHDVWANFRAEHVYRADALGVIRTGARWLTLFSLGWALNRWRRAKPRSLLDNQPLRELLTRRMPVQRIPGLIQQGALRAFSVSASSYSSGEHVTFYEADREVAPWQRSQRIAVRTRVGIEHLMASSAIPFVFPAVGLPIREGAQFFGDGSMRQSAPLSPAIHLGAERLFVVGAGRLHEPQPRTALNGSYPSLAQIGGHALSNIFLDALAVDIERATRINQTVALLESEGRSHPSLRPLEMLVVSPSERIDDIAARHVGDLPAGVRSMLRALGVSRQGEGAIGGGALTSYLLFERAFTRELIALGERDLMAREDEVRAFFRWPSVGESRPQRPQ